jgi:hypothetical protein
MFQAPDVQSAPESDARKVYRGQAFIAQNAQRAVIGLQRSVEIAG